MSHLDQQQSKTQRYIVEACKAVVFIMTLPFSIIFVCVLHWFGSEDER